MPIRTDLRFLLAKRRLKLGELARKVGVTAGNLSRLGNGHARSVRLSTLDALCSILKCLPGDILTYYPPELYRRAFPRGRPMRRTGISRRYERFTLLTYSAFGALEDGKHKEAKALACELLDSAQDYADDWNRGNALHIGNIVLGHLALLNDRVAEAKARQLDSARILGSPQLNTFGPNFSLAHKLLKRGERGCVLDFMESCAKFWAQAHGSDRLAKWRREIRAGHTPDFGPNMGYLT